MDLDMPLHKGFHPRVTRWFDTRFGQPTPIQRKAWPRIAAGQHVLLTAPTGSGKTLAAFLWAIDQLISDRWAPGATRILYVSPLKALNNDIQRNLIAPLREIREDFERHGEAFPTIRVATRSGDTPPQERRRMVRQPPEILITTPESLHLMLASMGGRRVLNGIRTVIVDEIHAVIGNKRGTLLMTAVDRLVPLCGEFQRIALSATIQPETVAAGFVGGFMMEGNPEDPVFVPRSVVHCRDAHRPPDEIRVRIPDAVMAAEAGDRLWEDLAGRLRRIIDRHRSSIVFTNSRRLCEKLTFLINGDGSAPVAYAHHGSLAKALRLEVEQHLKSGELKAIVATSSMELGIDIGALDHVILVQSPMSVSSAVQRIGRAGHGVGQTSRATFFATHATDALCAAVLADAVKERQIEPIRPVESPLDVLAQVLVAMIGVERWNLDALYHRVRTSYPFRRLERETFNLVVEMLAGRYAGTRLPALQPKIALDRIDHTLTARKGALLTLYASGGVIPDRGYFGLRHHRSGARIGELDEEFVWEARKGQVFTLGTQNWRIVRITQRDVLVRAARSKSTAPPFWRAEGVDRDFHLAEKIAGFLETAQRQLDDPAFHETLCHRYGMAVAGAGFLIAFLKRQQEKTGCPLPHRHHVVVERIADTRAASTAGQVVVHTFWGGRVNRPFALAMEAAWERRFGHAPSIFPTNDAITILLPQTVDLDAIMELVDTREVEALLRQRLESSGLFGARFRECAGRALLLPRQRFSQRMPLWLMRQQSQRLLEALGRFDDFPILLETWRTCLKDDFDLDALNRVLQELARGEITWSVVAPAAPSPMALAGAWRQINQYMYADDRPSGKARSSLSEDLLQMLTASPGWRPALDAATVAAFEQTRQRMRPGYAPDTPVELLEWVKERVLMTAAEWQGLVRQAVVDSGTSTAALLDPLSDRLVWVSVERQDEAACRLIVAAEAAADIHKALFAGRRDVHWMRFDGGALTLPAASPADPSATMDAGAVVAQWLRFFGPVDAGFLRDRLHLAPAMLNGILDDLVENGALIAGIRVEGQATPCFCDAENYAALLRMARKQREPAIDPRDVADLALVLAHHQHVTRSANNDADLAQCLAPLVGLALPAALWESDVLPARLRRYDPEMMDRLMPAADLIWFGRPGRRIAFCHEADLDLVMPPDLAPENDDDEAAASMPAMLRHVSTARGRYRLSDLLDDPPRPAGEVLRALWAAVWKGWVTNDTLRTLRYALAHDFYRSEGGSLPLPPVYGSSALLRRSRRRRPRNTIATPAGNWRRVPWPELPEGLIDAGDLVKERVRLLLDRYGILFRQLLAREAPGFRWPDVFRALRLMELSGEVVSGLFFKDVDSLQFVSKPMLELLQRSLPEDAVFWIHSMDPASLCGLDIDELKKDLPRRSPATHLVYLGRRLVMVSRRRGRILTIHLPPSHPRVDACFDLFDHLLGRRVVPLNAITVETINATPAAQSHWLEVLQRRFDTVVGSTTVTLYRRRHG